MSAAQSSRGTWALQAISPAAQQPETQQTGQQAETESPGRKLLGYKGFKRQNPLSDKFQVTQGRAGVQRSQPVGSVEIKL